MDGALPLEILLPYLTRHFYMEVLRGVEEALADTDYSIVIRTMEHVADRDRAFAACCLRGRADGVLFISVLPSDDLVERLILGAFPAVIVDGVRDGVSSVAVDHAAGMLAATRHCIALGHQRMALVDHHEDPFAHPMPTERQLGYRRGLAEAGIEGAPSYEQITEFSPEAGAQALDFLMALPEPPTAILVGSDTQAMGIVDAARRHGLRVPEDLSVVGYNDVELARYLNLTTVRVPMSELGRRGVERLLAADARVEQSPTTEYLPTELVVRRSCGPPP